MRKITHLFLDPIVLGLVGAFAAQVFDFLLKWVRDFSLGDIAHYIAPGLPTEGEPLQQIIGSYGLWLVPAVIVIGGIISGVIVYSLAPEAEGHGTDTAVKAFHQSGGRIRGRVTPIKILTSAITIGTGGSAGREGPTALFSAGIGSIYASVFKRSDRDRRLLVLIGMASGLSAIFRSPIGTAIFATEVLYRDMEFEASALIFTLLGSIIAYAVNAIFVGWNPLFQIPSNIATNDVADYVWYAVLGLSSGIVGTLIPTVFYGVRDLFHRMKIAPHFKPAIGAFGVGLIALAFPQVLGGGYGWIQLTINGQMVAGTLIVLIFAKLAAFALTVSSGGSGGVFAPTLFVGAMVGGALATVFHQPPAAFAVIGMAAVFGSAARVPIATLLMVTEMTGGYELLVPAALAVSLAYVAQDLLSGKLKYRSLYEAQVDRRSDSPAHRTEHLQEAIEMLAEKKALHPDIVGSLDITELLKSSLSFELPDGNQLAIATVDKGSRCVGMSIKDSCGIENHRQFEVAAIERGEHLIFPDQDTILKEGDQLLIFGKQDTIEEFKKKLLQKN